MTAANNQYSVSYETKSRKFGTFAGMMIAPAPLYYNGTSFEIREEDDWTSSSYNVAHGKVAGSYNFSRTDLGQFFDNRGVGYVAGTPINNMGNKISYDEYDDWRLPRRDEWEAITGTGRTGSTVNGIFNVHYAVVYVNDVPSESGRYSATFGTLLFPDGETITGSIDAYDNTENITWMTYFALNSFLRQGCVYIPFREPYYNGWQYGSTNYPSYHLTGNDVSKKLVYIKGYNSGIPFFTSYSNYDYETQALLIRGPYQSDYAEFAGLYITRAPLWSDNHTSTTFGIYHDDWNYHDYDDISHYGTTHFYQHFHYLGKYFSSQGSSYAPYDHGPIDNFGNRVSCDGIINWRMPTADEWSAIIGTSRPGSTVNGFASKHYAYVRLTDPPFQTVTEYDEYYDEYYTSTTDNRGLLLFPDNKTITGKSLSYMDAAGSTLLSWEELNFYISQGAVFLPFFGRMGFGKNDYKTAYNGGGSGYYHSSLAPYGGTGRPSYLHINENSLPRVMSDYDSWYSTRLVSSASEFYVKLTAGDGIIQNKAYLVTRTSSSDVTDQCTWSINAEGKVEASYSFDSENYTAASPQTIASFASLLRATALIDNYDESNEIAHNKSYVCWLKVPLETGVQYTQYGLSLSSSNSSIVSISSNTLSSHDTDGSAVISAMCSSNAVANNIDITIRNFSYEVLCYSSSATELSSSNGPCMYRQGDGTYKGNAIADSYSAGADGGYFKFGIVFNIYVTEGGVITRVSSEYKHGLKDLRTIATGTKGMQFSTWNHGSWGGESSMGSWCYVSRPSSQWWGASTTKVAVVTYRGEEYLSSEIFFGS